MRSATGCPADRPDRADRSSREAQRGLLIGASGNVIGALATLRRDACSLSQAIHAMYGGAAPRASGGFTVYRPWHWSLEGSDLYYGDVIGGRPDCVAAYEIDGCQFTIRDGLPYPTGSDGAPANLSIVAMARALLHEDHHNATMANQMNSVSTPGIKGDGQALPHLEEHEGVRHPKYGAGTMYVVGSTDWVVGLQNRNWFVERITRTVLDRLSGPRPSSGPGRAAA